MDQWRPTPEWKVLLEPFQSYFTKPGYRYFCAFVIVFAHLDGRLWVTQVVLGSFLKRHFSSFYRFLAEGSWSTQQASQALIQLCLSACSQGEGRLYGALDDTVCPKYGRYFWGLGLHYDALKAGQRQPFTRGHCFVCLALLAEEGLSHWAALFVRAALYLGHKTKEQGRKIKTKAELALILLEDLGDLKGRSFYLAVDGAYASRTFVGGALLRGVQVISRLPRHAVFYELPGTPRGRGRHPVYGVKRKAWQWAQDPSGYEPVDLVLYGARTKVTLKSRIVLLRRIGVRARLVAVRCGNSAPALLFCTDPFLSSEEITRVYGARFAIENGFRDAKQSFALSTYQVRRGRSIIRIIHLCLWAQTLMRLWGLRQRPEPPPTPWRKALGYLTLSQLKYCSRRYCRISSNPASTY